MSNGDGFRLLSAIAAVLLPADASIVGAGAVETRFERLKPR